jgi:hypothetical protein
LAPIGHGPPVAGAVLVRHPLAIPTVRGLERGAACRNPAGSSDLPEPVRGAGSFNVATSGDS